MIIRRICKFENWHKSGIENQGITCRTAGLCSLALLLLMGINSCARTSPCGREEWTEHKGCCESTHFIIYVKPFKDDINFTKHTKVLFREARAAHKIEL